jgi:hypothetical protein
MNWLNITRVTRAVSALLAAAVIAGCSASPSDVGGGNITATGCKSQMSVGEQAAIRSRWRAPKIAKYTVVWLHGVKNFTVNNVFDEHLSHAQPSDVSEEYDLPGPQSTRTNKAVVAIITAHKAGSNTIKIRVWGSGNFDSAPPSNAASLSCSVVINP